MSQGLSIAQDQASVDRSLQFFRALFPEPRNYSVRLRNVGELLATRQEDFSLVFHNPSTLKRIFSPPLELSLGEAYIHGEFDIEGDFFKIFNLLDVISNRLATPGEIYRLARAYTRLPSGEAFARGGRGPVSLAGRIHSKERDRQAVRYHYDVGNEFYALFLDKSMQYSCAYFPTGTETLDEAQVAKLEHICRKLRLKAGERLLDVGCGWGALVRYAVKNYGVTAVGVTLSEKQAGYANRRIAEEGWTERAMVEVRDYRDLEHASFDKIVSVGMFEHVGRDHLPEYFSQMYRLLKPGGLFLNHGISLRQAPPDHPEIARRLLARPHTKLWTRPLNYFPKKILGIGTFSQNYIFPDGELVLVSDANLFAEAAGFEVRDVENLREHYAITLRKWVNRLEDHRDQAIELAGEVTYRTWRLYLSSSVHGFESGRISVNQTLLAKTTDGKSTLPLSRKDLYID